MSATDEAAQSKLLAGVQSDDPRRIREAIKEGADPRAPVEADKRGARPAHEAMRLGALKALRELVKAGAELTEPSAKGIPA